MSERTTDRTRDEEFGVADDGDLDGEFDADVSDGLASDVDGGPSEFDADFGVGETADETSETSRVGSVTSRATDVFSPSAFAIQFVGALLGVFVLGNLIPLVPFAGFVGLFVMAGLMGTLSSESRYVEAAAAGGASGALSLLLGSLGLSVATGGVVPVVGAAVGAVAALVGFYAGRDLRDGVTRDL